MRHRNETAVMGKVKEGPQTTGGNKNAPEPAKDRDRSKEKATSTSKPKAKESSWLSNLWSTDFYKVSQGRRMRGFTFIALTVLVGVGSWKLKDELEPFSVAVRYGVPLAVLALGAWAAHRTVQYPRFAEFLIATEAEMNKVSWISGPDLKRSTQVVMVTVVLLSLYLFAVDWLWTIILRLFGVIAA